MRKIAVIDADLIGKSKHRFPNLCSMKISAYHKSIGDDVVLKIDYDGLDAFDKVFISKVFVKTEVPGEPDDKSQKTEDTVADWYKNNQFLNQPNIEYGGTGFFYDKAPPLPPEIEHIKPDYHLYDEWVETHLINGKRRSDFKYYLDYSIGYLTRQCFRGCKFCVNQNYKQVLVASPLSEFMDDQRPKLCFLDDNFFGYSNWRGLIETVMVTGKPFQFKQGLDERLLTKDKILSMSEWKYDGHLIFAFNNIEDEKLIVSKINLIYDTVPNWKKWMMFYVLCGFDRAGVYDLHFWLNDIENLFRRIKILSSYRILPYVMRHEKITESGFSSFYSNVAAWCNQPSFFKKKSFREFCIQRGVNKGGAKGASWREIERIETLAPDVAKEYFDFIGMKEVEI